MKIRKYKDSDWKNLWTLYNRTLAADQVTLEFFATHLLMNPNFDPAGVMVAEDGGQLLGAMVAQVLSRNISPWSDNVTPNLGTGFLMPPLISDIETGRALLPEAEKFFRERNRKLVKVVSAGPTLFPDALDKTAYPVAAALLEGNGFSDTGRLYSMRVDLFNHRTPEDVLRKRDDLAKDGIAARVCEWEDLPALRRFLEDGDLIGRMANVADKALRRALDEIVIVADDKDVFGYCQYNYYDEVERVGPFGVTSGLRGRGLGQVMVAKLLEVMAERGYICAYFNSCSEQNVRFYAKNDFAVYREKTNYQKTLE